MKTFSKLLVASALAASFAAPAFAWDVQFEGLTLQERNVYTNPKPAPANNGTRSYAMESRTNADRAPAWHVGRDLTSTIQ